MTEPYRPLNWTPPEAPAPADWRFIGHLGVDSGRILLSDPSYVPAEIRIVFIDDET